MTAMVTPRSCSQSSSGPETSLGTTTHKRVWGRQPPISTSVCRLPCSMQSTMPTRRAVSPMCFAASVALYSGKLGAAVTGCRSAAITAIGASRSRTFTTSPHKLRTASVSVRQLRLSLPEQSSRVRRHGSPGVLPCTETAQYLLAGSFLVGLFTADWTRFSMSCRNLGVAASLQYF